MSIITNDPNRVRVGQRVTMVKSRLFSHNGSYIGDQGTVQEINSNMIKVAIHSGNHEHIGKSIAFTLSDAGFSVEMEEPDWD